MMFGICSIKKPTYELQDSFQHNNEALLNAEVF